MTLTGQILLAVLVLIGLVTLASLGRPRAYPDRGVAWWMVAATWSTLLIDGLFCAVFFSVARGAWVAYVFEVFLGLRIPVGLWLLWMIRRGKRRS